MDLEKYAQRKGRTVEIDLGDGDTVEVSYNNAAATPKFFKTIAGVSKKIEVDDLTGSLDTSVAIIVGLVTKWSLTLKGKPLPLTTAGVELVPMEILGLIVEAIFEDQNPGND